jgi:hypothetical protein
MSKLNYFLAYDISTKKLFICRMDHIKDLIIPAENFLGTKQSGSGSISMFDLNLKNKLKDLKNPSGESISGPIPYELRNCVELEEYTSLVGYKKMPFAKK